jgi:hypothetical protein
MQILRIEDLEACVWNLIVSSGARSRDLCFTNYLSVSKRRWLIVAPVVSAPTPRCSSYVLIIHGCRSNR